MDPMTPTILTAIVLALIPKLGHDDFKHREKASAGLARLLDFCPEPIIANEYHANPEIAQRCKMLADKWYAKHAEELVDDLIPKGWDRFPWIDSLGWLEGVWEPSTASRTQHYLKLAQKLLPPNYNSGYPWPAYSMATRLYLVDLIRARIDTKPIIEKMIEGDVYQCQNGSWPLPPIPQEKTPCKDPRPSCTKAPSGP
jgi:hypothetical protein